MRYKFVWGLIAEVLVAAVLTAPVNVHAEGDLIGIYDESNDDSSGEDEKWDANKAWFTKLYDDCEDCNPVRCGGVNKLDGIEAHSREEVHTLENHLTENGYSLASTSQCEISDEDIEMLKSVCWVGGAYIGDEPFVSDGKYFKVYIYNPTLRTARKQWKENHTLDFHVQWEITTSSVLVNYYVYDEMDKMGKTFGVEEINENMPAQYQENAGFVEFSCPIDAEIKLYSADHEYYYLLYLHKGKTLMKLRGDHYELVEINGHDVARGDIALTNGNYFVVWQQPQDAPLQVEFSQLVKRDDIGGMDITGKPDCRWQAVYEDVDINDEGDVIVDDTDGMLDENVIYEVCEPQKKIFGMPLKTFWGAFGAIGILALIATALILIKKRKR